MREISTHALREEGDLYPSIGCIIVNISTHALREEGDSVQPLPICSRYNFYPRPPRGGRPVPEGVMGPRLLEISTHALREEGDKMGITSQGGLTIFLPTPSARRATLYLSSSSTSKTNFYPRPPRGGRQRHPHTPSYSAKNFYPRPPRGGRPPAMRCASNVEIISTHALREEGDVHGRQGQGGIPISTHALREEGDGVSNRKCCKYHKISTHALREEGDSPADTQRYQHRDFYPRPPRGGRQFYRRTKSRWGNFYPRPPRGGRPPAA